MVHLREMFVLDFDIDNKTVFTSTIRSAHHQSMYDPSDNKDNPTKEKHKGRRYCFVVAVLDSPTMESKVMALDIFTGGTKAPAGCPKTPKARKEPKDYHGMFDHAYYVKWFGLLLDELDSEGIPNALIVLATPCTTSHCRHRLRRVDDA
ncbi:hypothetical protein DYB38_011628 [Aphanomyces astaci]|uniref:Uncharacterized protein n=1 Tax=Aphanomyces astaci TaxID=112090 RepID=A0A397DR45_APHAT|nr:hypothetical protein DYB38_011628 [Aphanomyces astaci]